MQYKLLKNALRLKSSTKKAEGQRRFFKTGKGQYAEGDIFIGVTVPEIRSIVKMYPSTPLSEIKKLLKSEIHEERSLGILLLIHQFKKADTAQRSPLFNFYLKNLSRINNWDLVDNSAPAIMGAYCFEIKSHEVMDQLLTSKRHWDRRIAIVGTLFFIRQGKTQLTFNYARALLRDQEDLMHKATGWMLREAGKKNEQGLKNFIKTNVRKMPRTMLRYSIEKFSPSERASILKQK